MVKGGAGRPLVTFTSLVLVLADYLAEREGPGLVKPWRHHLGHLLPPLLILPS